jgi:hypothetical protein
MHKLPDYVCVNGPCGVACAPQDIAKEVLPGAVDAFTGNGADTLSEEEAFRNALAVTLVFVLVMILLVVLNHIYLGWCGSDGFLPWDPGYDVVKPRSRSPRRSARQEPDNELPFPLPDAQAGAQEDECAVCRDNKRQVAFIPCGHRILCFGCANSYSSETCALCATPHSGMYRIYE